MKKNCDDEQENTTAYRVRRLRQDREWSQKELADKIFVAHSQISRLESRETTNIGSALLVSLANLPFGADNLKSDIVQFQIIRNLYHRGYQSAA